MGLGRGRWAVAAGMAAAGLIASSVPAGAASYHRYVIVAKTPGSYAAVRAEAVASGARVVQDMRQIGAIVVMAPTSTRDKLRGDLRVYGVSTDHRETLTPPDTARTRNALPGLLGANGLPTTIDADPAFDISRLLWSIRAVMRVRATGARALTLMSYLAPSAASTRVKPTRPILAAP